MSEEPDYLLSTSFVFGGREFQVTVAHDDFSYWFDSYAYNDALKREPLIIAKAAGGPESGSYKRLSQIYDEWTVKAPIPDDDLRRIREELSPRYWAESCGDDFDLDEQLDTILEPIFWNDVNPQLSIPVQRP